MTVYFDFQLNKKWEGMTNVAPRPPPGFQHFLLNTHNYLLESNASTNASKLAIPLLTAPIQVAPPLKELFNRQERDRYKLRQQHLIETVGINRSSPAPANQQPAELPCSTQSTACRAPLLQPINSLQSSPAPANQQPAECYGVRCMYGVRLA